MPNISACRCGYAALKYSSEKSTAQISAKPSGSKSLGDKGVLEFL